MIIGIDASRTAVGLRTGTEAYATFLIRTLISQAAEKDHTIRLYFNQPPAPDLFPRTEYVDEVIIPFRRLWTHIRLARELRKNPPDIFFTPAHVIPLTYHGRAAATIHDLGYHAFPEAHPKSQLAYLKWSTQHNGRRATVIFADSEATRDDLMTYYQVPAAKVAVVYPSIDPDMRPVNDEAMLTAVQQKYGVSRPYLLTISTMQPRKNWGRLVQAYAQSGLPHQLVLAGKKGWLSQSIQDEIADLPAPISANVKLPGYIADADKAALISGATAVLYPSLYEGFGFPILEAQVCGVPVLTASTSSCPEVAGDGALLVDPLDAAAIARGLKRLVEDEALRHELVSKGYENSRRFSWRAAAAQVLDLLETAVATGSIQQI